MNWIRLMKRNTLGITNASALECKSWEWLHPSNGATLYFPKITEKVETKSEML